MSLYGNDQDFWTSSDEEETGQEEESSDDDVDEVKAGDIATSTEEALQRVYDEVQRLEIQENGDEPKIEYVTGAGAIPEPVIAAPSTRAIRKHWVLHDTLPTDNFKEEIPDLALEYPFELDDFQKRAIRHVHKREHTFVAAHTSAGKTVVAEYSIALAAKRGRRAVYTSPVKALSNQKFREFKNKFESVGIITGDVSVNPGAQCLILTTEILRAMLYRSDAILNQLDVVIFDEVHYVNDAERGVVWEEVIIMLPRDVCLVMLSATVPNYKEFADWIGRTKRREVFAISTTKRPTPLKHFLWVDDKEFLVMEQAKFRVEAFNEVYKHRRETSKAVAAKAAAGSSRGGRSAGGKEEGKSRGGGRPNVKVGRGGGGAGTPGSSAKQKTDTHRLQSLIKRLESNSQLPVVVFCFSRYKCEKFPESMPKLDLLSQEDKSKVHIFVKDSFSALSESDRNLPQVDFVSGLLRRGVGIHHGGLLPIVKECVEILFQRGLVRVLVATETFAMGVNMPARSVIFASIEKQIGTHNSRTLISSEYTQMAGRAGRRGLDAFGSVYILCSSDQLPDQTEVTKMMMEKAIPLQSRFRLTFEMLLHLSSHRNLKMEDMMAMSFGEYSRAKRLPTLKRDQNRINKELKCLAPIECIFGDHTAMDRYSTLEISSRKLATQLHSTLWRHQYSLVSNRPDPNNTFSKAAPFCDGRVIAVHSLPIANCTCVAAILGIDVQPTSAADTPRFRILALTSSPPSDGGQVEGNGSDAYHRSQIKTLLASTRNPYGQVAVDRAGSVVIKSGLLRSSNLDEYSPGASFGFHLISSVPLECIGLVTNSVLDVDTADCMNGENETALLLAAKSLDRVNIAAAGKWQPLSLSKHLKQVEIEFFETLLQQKELVAVSSAVVDSNSSRQELFSKLNASSCHSCSLKEKHFGMVKHRRDCEYAATQIEHLLRVESLDLYDEMKLKYQILQKRQFVDSNSCITLKGQVASAITSNDDITLTEALFAGIFQNLTPSETAAALSAFVFPDKANDSPAGPTQALVECRDKIEQIHSAIQAEMQAIRISLVHEQWWKICNFGLASVVYQWAEGRSFAEIMKSTELQEGTIVRSILRLDELIRKIRVVAKTLLDDSALASLMEEASKRIHRDIIFVLSLYLQ